MSDTDFIKTVAVFQDLTDSQLALVGKCSRPLDGSYGDKLFEEGDAATHLWVVVSGRVDLRFELPGRTATVSHTIASVSERGVFGWSSFVPPYRYGLSAYCAVAGCRVLKIDSRALARGFGEDPGFGYRMMANLTAVVGRRFFDFQAAVGSMPLSQVKITVHMATCGIAAGARDVMQALTEEIAREDRQDIAVATAGCIGACHSEPNVTVAIQGQDPVVYRQMDADKIRQVFHNHVLGGKVQTEWVLAGR